ncbi:hypothetical protein [Fundidesulfovibrio agrisoli]|uniref:hypothetical protein n=1 Tax=Fundidesulfovibrio agrisoli TaxID=2922717 RepID=UPI001FAE45D3|nr:hypothetical protein [Fundidesulfovibrio agrisoli]
MSILNDIGMGLMGFSQGLDRGLDRQFQNEKLGLMRRAADREDKGMEITSALKDMETQKLAEELKKNRYFMSIITGENSPVYSQPSPPFSTQQSAPLSWTSPSTGGSAPIWQRNNNPGNIRVPGQNAFQAFPSMEAGTQAMVDLLGRYNQGGHNTIWKIVSRYAPAGDGNNNPEAYSANVAQMTGLDVHQPLDWNDPMTRFGVTRAMMQQEGSAGGVNPSVLAKATGLGEVPMGWFPAQPMQSAQGAQYAANNTGTATDATGAPRPQQPYQPSAHLPAWFTDPNRRDQISTLAGMGYKPAIDALNSAKLIQDITKRDIPEKLDGAQWFKIKFGRDFDPGNRTESALVKEYNQANSTQSVNVNMPPEQEASAKEQAKIFNDARVQIAKDADGALKTLTILNHAEPLLDASGSLSNIKKTVGGLAQALGLGGQLGGLIESANDINTLQALSARMLLPIVQNTTAFHTNFSDADRRSIESMNISPQNLPEVNRRLMEIARTESGLALQKQQHFTGLKDYADYEGRLAGWNQAQAKRLEDERPGRKQATPSDIGAGPAPASPSFKTPDDVKAAFQSGQLSQDQAASILRNQFGME